MSEDTLLEIFNKVIDGYEFMLEKKIGSEKDITAELVHHKAMREILLKSINGLKKDLVAKPLQELVDERFGKSMLNNVHEG